MSRCEHVSVNPYPLESAGSALYRCPRIAVVKSPKGGGYRFLCGLHALRDLGDMWGRLTRISFAITDYLQEETA